MTIEPTYNNVPTFYAPSRATWREWLANNAESEKSVWLIMFRKESDVDSVYYDDAVEEALCFGWIDSKPNKRDDKSYYLFFSQRKLKSNWSKANRDRVERLEAQRLIMPAGQKMIDYAKANGQWTALVDVQNNVIPPDLQAAFDANPNAWGYFEKFAPSSKRGILEWILNAKTDATRLKRINETVTLAEQNIKANHYRQ